MGEPALERVAIVGMGCVFPGAPTVDALWRNICAGVDAIGEVPPDRWDPVFYAPDPRDGDGGGGAGSVDRFYCRRGGFIDDVAHFDPVSFGIMPVALEGGEPDQFLALAQAAAALDDSGRAHEHTPPERVGVVVGRGGYRTPGVARLDQRVHVAQQLVESLQSLLPELPPERVEQVRAEFVGQLGHDRPEASIGLVPNLAASRIANRFDFQGPAYTVDAACASSLVAVDHALRELSSRRCDLVLAGGVHHCHDVTLWSVFTQLGALSRRQEIRPFSRLADGILVGEGTGFFALKRFDDAKRDDDRIYAVICGSGVASDGRSRGLMSPDVAGQVLALERAWQAAGLDPATVGLVEAHGTATPAGDEAELESLRQVFGKVDAGDARAGLGSVKSMIGHAMPAAGAAGLAKAALAVHHGVLPPTLHADDPHPWVEPTRFRLVQEAEPWEGPGPRRAGVNAFGFGGINAHLVLEQHGGSARRRDRRPLAKVAAPAHDDPIDLGDRVDLPSVLRIAAADTTALSARLDDWIAAQDESDPAASDWPLPSIGEVQGDGEGVARLAVVDVTPRRLELVRKVVAQGTPWRGRNGVWFEPHGLLAAGPDGRERGKLAFLFPGVEPSFEPQLDDVARHFGLDDLLGSLGDDETPAMSDLERQSRGIFAVGRLLHRVLAELDVQPDMVAGHSLGEWSGEIAAGVVPDHLVDTFLDQLQPGSVEVADVLFLALGCGARRAGELIAELDLDRTSVSHDNCPHQSVVCGPPDEIARVAERCREQRVLTQELPFRSGFHSPLFTEHLPATADALGSLPLAAPAVPLWSATTCRPYPDAADDIRALAARHLVEPVRFRELVLALHDAGARVFVQVGVGSLTGFVDDTLRDRTAVTVAAASPKRSGLAQLCHLGAALWTEGWPIALDGLVGRQTEVYGRSDRGSAARSERPLRLSLGTRLVRDLTPLQLDLPDPVAEPAPAATGRALPQVGARDLVVAAAAAAAGTIDEVTQALATKDSAAVPVAPADTVLVAPPSHSPPPTDTIVRVRRFALDVEPAWSDHAFFRQPAGWPYEDDRFPLVPMTGIVEVLMETARELHPGLLPIAVEDVAAFRWLTVEPPTEATIRATTLESAPDETRVRVAIDGHARATVVLAAAYPAAPPAPEVRLRNERPSHVEASRFYRERHMFHGPAYQGVRAFLALGDDGARAILKSLPAPGALLDNAGQLMGYWLSSQVEVDRLVLPTSIERIELFGPHPSPGTLVDCSLTAGRLDDRALRGNLQLAVEGRLWCRITNWEDRRFATDALMFETLLWPERAGMSVERAGYTLIDERWPDSPSRDVVMRRYLGRDERRAYEQHHPLGQRRFLLGRIAVKDAVRRWLWSQGHGPLFPAEVVVADDARGQPLVRGPFAADLRVTQAHVENLAVARVAEGADVGIDIQRVDTRRAGFEEVVLTPHEQRLAAPDGYGRDTWLTCLWAVKEAAARAGGAAGVDGRPKDHEIVERQGLVARIGGMDVAFERLPQATAAGATRKEHVIAWTLTDR